MAIPGASVSASEIGVDERADSCPLGLGFLPCQPHRLGARAEWSAALCKRERVVVTGANRGRPWGWRDSRRRSGGAPALPRPPPSPPLLFLPLLLSPPLSLSVSLNLPQSPCLCLWLPLSLSLSRSHTHTHTSIYSSCTRSALAVFSSTFVRTPYSLWPPRSTRSSFRLPDAPPRFLGPPEESPPVIPSDQHPKALVFVVVIAWIGNAAPSL